MQKLIDIYGIYNNLQDEFRFKAFTGIWKNDTLPLTIYNKTDDRIWNNSTFYNIVINPKYHFLETLQKDDGFNKLFWKWMEKKKYALYSPNYQWVLIKNFKQIEPTPQMLTGYLIEYVTGEFK